MKTFVVDNSFLQSVWSCFDVTTTHLKIRGYTRPAPLRVKSQGF